MSVEKRFRILNVGLVVAAALVAALTFAGCGGDDPKDEPTKEPKTWALAEIPAEVGALSNIAYGKGVFVAATYNPAKIIWSEDGETWQEAEGVSADSINNAGSNYVFFGADEFVVVDRSSGSGEKGKWLKSANGKTWNALNSGATLRSAGGGAYGNGVYVIGAQSHTVYISEDGTAWEAKATGTGINWVNGVAYGNGKFVITGMNGVIAWSSNPTEDDDPEAEDYPTVWQVATYEDSEGSSLFGSSATVNSVVFGSGRFMAVGGTGTNENNASQNIALTSSDGITWTQTGDTKETSQNNYIYLGYGAGVFITGGNDGSAAYTTDAYNWTLIDDTKLTKITGIAYGGGKFVMVGTDTDGPAIAWSTPE